jgi:hydrogenase expression/formation protein HypE
VYGQLGGRLFGLVQIRQEKKKAGMKQDKHDRVLLAHGGGGKLTDKLIRQYFLPRFRNNTLAELADAAKLNLESGALCFTTDSYVVKPLFFSGGDIGKLAVCGTINDLAVSGARPVALALALIIEEGFEFRLLEKILDSIAQTACENDVAVVTGDTKTVEKGAADKIFINTAGIGVRIDGVELGFDKIRAGDAVIISGTIGDHGMTIMSQREDIGFQSELTSDCAALSALTSKLLVSATGIRFMRDPTRGGLAATLNEIVSQTGLSIEINEQDIPVKPTVQAAADMLGLDVLNIANEGKFVAVVSQDCADDCIKICHRHPLGRQAAIIGEVVKTEDVSVVEMTTKIGGRRIVQMPYGRELPRIC